MKEMTSRERVIAAFNFNEPDRVPCWCGASREFWEKAKKELSLDDEGLQQRFGSDFRSVFAKYVGPKLKDSFTVFGIERKGDGYGQPMNHPLEHASVKEINAYPWPDPKWHDPSVIRAQAEIYGKRFAILGGNWSPLWHDAIDLLGMENICVKMYEDPDAVDAVLLNLADFYYKTNKIIFEAAAKHIDILFIGNDLGSQNGPLISPELFRRFLVPHLTRLIGLGHEYGLKVQLHCCGGIEPLLDDLIKIKLDAIHAVQTTCVGMELSELKKKYGKMIVFNGGVDSHHVLMNSTPAVVKEKTIETLKIMMPGGGYVAGASHDSILVETPVKNVLTMFDTVREFKR